MSGLHSVSDVAPAAIGAAAGGFGAFWFAKLLLNRMLNQYDKKHDEHAAEIKSINEKISSAHMRIAVLETILDDARRLRIDVAERVASMKAELETRHAVTVNEVSDLRTDVYVAHERVRLLANGDTDFSKVKKPQRFQKR